MITCAALLYTNSSCNYAYTQCGASAGACVVRRRALVQRVVKPDSMLAVGHSWCLHEPQERMLQNELQSIITFYHG